MPSPPTIEFRRNDRTVVVGDSNVANGRFWPFAALVTNAVAPRSRRVYPGYPTVLAAQGSSAYVPRVSLPPQRDSGMVWINSGVAGNDIGDVNVATRITAHNPDMVLIYALGINDRQHFVQNGTPTEAESATNLDNLLTASKLANPNARHAYISPVCWNEQWTAGNPPTGNNSQDAGIDSMVALLQAVCAAQDVFFFNPRPALWLWESSGNNPAPQKNFSGTGGTIITTDGIHLTPSVGAPWLASVIMPFVVVG